MANVRPEKLAAALQNHIAPVYLVSGDEALLVQEACDTIRHTAKNQGYAERELYHSEAGFDWHYLSQNLNSLSLFADKKIIEVRIANGKIDESASHVIREFCEQAPDDTLLLLVMPKLDKRVQNYAWYKAIDQCGVTVAVWPVGPDALPHWVDQRLRAAGMKADSAAIDVLCTKVEGNLLAAVQEIEKLKLLGTNELINATTMTEAVMDSARYSVFTLVDRALSGDSRSAVRTLQGLQGEGLAPLTVVWALSREVKNLIALREMMDAGNSFDFAAKRTGVWASRKGLVHGAIQRLRLAQLQQIYRLIGLADRSVKGMAADDEWNILLDAVLNLAGVQSLNKATQKLALNI